MRFFLVHCNASAYGGLVYGQTAAQQADSSTNTSSVGAELKALREALLRTQQQVAS